MTAFYSLTSFLVVLVTSLLLHIYTSSMTSSSMLLPHHQSLVLNLVNEHQSNHWNFSILLSWSWDLTWILWWHVNNCASIRWLNWSHIEPMNWRVCVLCSVTDAIHGLLYTTRLKMVFGCGNRFDNIIDTHSWAILYSTLFCKYIRV